MIGNASSHCWRDSQRSVNPAQIVIREVERQRSSEIVPGARESVRQTREPLTPLAQRSILVLNVRGTGAVQIGIAADRVLSDGDKFRWPVTFRNYLRDGREHLHHSGVISAVVQPSVNRGFVRLESIRT